MADAKNPVYMLNICDIKVNYYIIGMESHKWHLHMILIGGGADFGRKKHLVFYFRQKGKCLTSLKKMCFMLFY